MSGWKNVKIDRQLVILSIVSSLALLLGAIGFYFSAPDDGVLNALYLAVQLFSVESGATVTPTPPLIELARWLAMAALAWVVYSALLALFGHIRARVHIVFSKNHQIICGAGNRGLVIAAAMLSRNKSVVVIEIDPNNNNLGELRHLGAGVVIGNALDSAVREAAGIKRALGIVAVTGEDENNIAICCDVAEQCSELSILWASVESWPLRAYFIDMLDKRIRLESYLARVFRPLFQEVALEFVANGGNLEDNVSILIETDEAKLTECLRAAICLLNFLGDRVPRIMVTRASPEFVNKFRSRFPALDLVARVEWYESAAHQIFQGTFERGPDFAVVALDGNSDTVETCQYIARNSPNCVVRGYPASELLPLRKEKNVSFNKQKEESPVPHLQFRSFSKWGLGSQDPLEDSIDRHAKAIHEDYLLSLKDSAREAAYWLDISERDKEMNRLAAYHQPVKSAIWVRYQNAAPEAKRACLERLTRGEHMRWMAARVMDGWIWGERRSSTFLTHPNIVPFDRLTLKDREKDRVVVYRALGLSDEYVSAL